MSMAIQAQHPSNLLFLNRSGQDGKTPLGGNDYSLHPFPGGGGGGAGGGPFLDETEMLFNHGVDANSRKRGREAAAMSNPMISLQQSSQPQLIDLTQLHASPPPNVVSTGLRLAFGGDHQQQLHTRHHHHHHSLSPQSSQSSVFFSALGEDIGSHIKQQRDEIEHYLRAQGEQLRRELEEKRRRHYRALVVTAEESLTRRLREKESEVEKATRRHAELEARAAHLSAEAQAWQARARAQEMTAATLQAQLQQARASGGVCSAAAHHLPDRNDGGAGTGEAEDAESAYIDPDRIEPPTGSNCRACGKRVASVVLLPCRHLCLCRRCDAVAQACPLCFTVRSSSVEVFFC